MKNKQKNWICPCQVITQGKGAQGVPSGVKTVWEEGGLLQQPVTLFMEAAGSPHCVSHNSGPQHCVESSVLITKWREVVCFY